MDLDQETARLKTWGVVGILFLISLVFSWSEIRYMIWGKTVDAMFMSSQVEVRRGKYNRQWEVRVLGYAFMDGEKNRREYEDVPMDWETPESKLVKVQYIPGREFSSRLSGEHHWFWISVFFLILAYVGFEIARVWRNGLLDDD